MGDLMGARVELPLDKKKSLQQNLESLYDILLQRNISNHKTISKFIFAHSAKMPTRLPSKRQLKPTVKKLLDAQTPKMLQKQAKKKTKFLLACERAVSAKLKRK